MDTNPAEMSHNFINVCIILRVERSATAVFIFLELSNDNTRVACKNVCYYTSGVFMEELRGFLTIRNVANTF